MSVKVITLDAFADEIKGFTESTLEKQKKAVIRGLTRSIPDLVKASPVDTGLYAQSWDIQLTKESGTIGNTAPHAPIIEYGARPFKAPIVPLLQWAKRVLKDPSQPPQYSEAVRRLAYGTQAKIQKEGMKPRSVLQNTMPKIMANIKAEFERLNG